jgi:hypothetical protein
VTVDGPILGFPEFNPSAILEVGDVSPRGIAFEFALVGGDADLRGSLLELDRIDAGMSRGIDESQSQVEVAVVIDPDFGHDVGGLVVAHGALGQTDDSFHRFSFQTSP